MVGKTSRSKKAKPKKGAKKPAWSEKRTNVKPAPKPPPKPASKNISVPILHAQLAREPSAIALPPSRIFSIDLGTINGDTTIGDLIVAFPRTREVLMKHGLRFDVEEAGYLYMTLNVFSAIHGLTTHNLVQELDVASKAPPPIPLAAPPVRPIPTAPSA